MVMRSELVGLIVEDEWLLRMELAEELRRAGHEIEELASGEDALTRLAAGGPLHFLVTDIRLGGSVDGWRVAEAAREAYPKLGVIYVSANPIMEDRRVAGSIFLNKPCNVSALLRACAAVTS